MVQFFDSVKLFFEKLGDVMISFWSSGKWAFVTNVLDVLFVAFIIYNAIKLLKETRAVQLIKGIVILAAVYGIVTILKMQATSFIMAKVFDFAVIAIIILFQPEIRHALETVGRSKLSTISLFFTKGNNEVTRQERIRSSISSVCIACADMSREKIGALIVFERKTMLGELVKSATMVDAIVSCELIGNIFYPKAPLHDGAALIRDGRVIAAGCILPMTEQTTLSSSLGTRHRASIGMSEQSDAVVVVVSEETGAISYAYKGSLVRDVTVEELSKKLGELLLDYENGENTKKDNTGLKKRLLGGFKRDEKEKD